MSNQQIVEHKPLGAVGALAKMYDMDPVAFASTLRETVFPGGKATNEQLAAYCLVAKEYNLNPVLKQLYAFPSKGGGIVPMIGIDGWLTMVNNHPQMGGMRFRYERDEETKEVYGITCIIYRKDRTHPVEVTEFLDECKMATQPWAKKPMTMLRHRAIIQAARIAFSFSGIYGEEEAQEILEAELVQSAVAPPPKSLRGLMQNADAPTVREVEATVQPSGMSAEESRRLELEAEAEEKAREQAAAGEFFAGDDKGKKRKSTQGEH